MIARPNPCLAAAAHYARVAPAARAPAYSVIAFLIAFGHFEPARQALAAHERLGYQAPSLATDLAIGIGDLETVRSIISTSPRLFGDMVWKKGLLMYLEGNFEAAAELGKEHRERPDLQRPWDQFRLSLLERDVAASLDLFEHSIRAGETYPLFRASNGHAVYVPIFHEFYDLDPESLVRVRVPELPFDA